jgi:hypothetical protein
VYSSALQKAEKELARYKSRYRDLSEDEDDTCDNE